MNQKYYNYYLPAVYTKMEESKQKSKYMHETERT